MNFDRELLFCCILLFANCNFKKGEKTVIDKPASGSITFIFKEALYPSEKIAPIAMYSDPWLSFEEWRIGNKDGVEKDQVRKKYYAIAMKVFEAESFFLDSILARKEIPLEVYDFFKDNVKYSSLGLDLAEGKLSNDEATKIIKDHKERLFM
jgi:hypothetical protein